MLQDANNLLHTHLALAGTWFAYHLTLIHMVQDTNKVLAIKRIMVPYCSTVIIMVQDTNKVLAISRIMVAWQPLGLAMGCYDMCNRYLQQRQQFGSPLAAFQVT